MSKDRMLDIRFGILRASVAILVSLVVATIFIFIMSDDPMLSLYYMLISPFSNLRQIFGILERMIPLLFTGLAVCVMFAANQFNLAAEGSVMLGGFTAACVAIYMPLPMGIHPAVAILCAMVVCGIVMLIPAVLQTKLGVNVLVTSLMLNYVIQFVVLYFLVNHISDATQGALMSQTFLSTSMIPFMSFMTSYGIIIGAFMVVLVTLFMYRTKWGYAIRMVGINQEFSSYSGIKVVGIVVLCQVIGGMLAGMGGAVEMLGYFDRYRWRLLPGYGWNGITIAILAKNNPAFVPLGAFFLAYMSRGCVNMSIYTTVPAEMLEVIQAVIFLFFAAEHFLAKYRQKMVVKKARAEMDMEETSGEEVAG